MLKFFGNGSAFADTNTCAFFTMNSELVIIDFSMSAFPVFRDLDFTDIDSITVLVTHTHSDHISGLGPMIYYAYYILKLPRVTVAVPNRTIADNLSFLLCKLEGCNSDAFEIITTELLNRPWFIAAIPTIHSASLSGNCYGYALEIDYSLVIYTGDTHTLLPYLKLLQDDKHSDKYLYTEISAYNTPAHLFIDDNLEQLIRLSNSGVHVNLMHIDNDALIRENIQGTELRIVEKYFV